MREVKNDPAFLKYVPASETADATERENRALLSNMIVRPTGCTGWPRTAGPRRGGRFFQTSTVEAAVAGNMVSAFYFGNSVDRHHLRGVQ